MQVQQNQPDCALASQSGVECSNRCMPLGLLHVPSGMPQPATANISMEEGNARAPLEPRSPAAAETRLDWAMPWHSCEQVWLPQGSVLPHAMPQLKGPEAEQGR